MGFDLYFAGAYNQEIEKILIKNKYNKLLSNANDGKMIERYINLKKTGEYEGKLLIDSGAFSVHTKGKTIDLEKYIDFLNNNHEWIDLYIQVDDIPGKWGQPKTAEQLSESPKKTWQNYLYMRNKLIEPDKLLPVFHQEEDFIYLKQMLEYTENEKHIPYICISSNKELTAEKRLNWYKRCYEIIEESNNPNVKVHSLGTQSEKHCSIMPFTSTDATSWILAAANGSIYTKYGTIYISDRGINELNHIVNDSNSLKILQEYIESKGFTIDELKSNHNKRVEWNLLYLGEWAKNMNYIGPKSFKNNRLF